MLFSRSVIDAGSSRHAGDERNACIVSASLCIDISTGLVMGMESVIERMISCSVMVRV